MKASNTDENDRFGAAIAFSEGSLAVGARQEDSSGLSDPLNNSETNSGAVYIIR